MWDEPTVNSLIKLQKEGKTMSAIAYALGCTKNAVVGKLWRMGIRSPKRASSSKVPFPHYHGYGHKAIEEAPVNGCMWPFGNPKEEGFRFCGNRREAGRPYCVDHVNRAYRYVGVEDAYGEAAE